ncbi:precorrin-2 dehydrogenase/sirohydrochlorin ferrochelatase family protein [Paenibacillus elgii]|uniref:precorrin-2 dehydrogenase/sirohydrochlorin ferrochelatase family protein n=1 Tax=Paenibacillus elgii TaxID=189691 RepID=UPI00203AE923|nr:bifunctional precorrin-2 dehydrogenase/sirohydrochlorin ferrochelatase [Paenibacillus elgii]MCM3270904.1 bifunctional precorrin-2 dehydrogenase/sirohydrochlorin ferrochelatase [Paenibacillus elgii]
MTKAGEGRLPGPSPGVKSYYPAMLDLEGRPCAVIGGGRVAERKARALLEAGAHVTVVSPVFTPQLEAWAASGAVRALRERYAPGLPALAEARLVFAATDDASVNAQVCAEAEALGKFVNAADDGAGGGFLVPAAVRRGRLTLAVSTAGASPGLAAALRRRLEEAFGEEYAPYVELLHELRGIVQQAVPETGQRQELFRGMLEWELLSLLRSGRVDPAELRAELARRVLQDPTTGGIEAIGDWLRVDARHLGYE